MMVREEHESELHYLDKGANDDVYPLEVLNIDDIIGNNDLKRKLSQSELKQKQNKNTLDEIK